MKSFILFIILLNSLFLFSQENCENSVPTRMPPTPYSNGYLVFDGKGDFLRTQDDDRIDLAYNQTDNFIIETRLKISRPNVPTRILGKIYGSGWMLSYNVFQSGVVSFSIGNINKDVYALNADTNWHSYKITFSRDSSVLITYVDNVITNTYTNFVYGNTANDAAFTVGNVGMPATFGFHSYLLNGYWFKGSIDFLKLYKNSALLLNYNFDEGIGQYAKDSASYFVIDRVFPGWGGCGAMHFMLGFMLASDTCDPQWVTDENTYPTDFYPLSTGLSYYYQNITGSSYIESFSLSLTLWNGYLVNGGFFNRAGETEAKNIAMWNGTQWYPVGGGFNHEVICLASYKGELYAGGWFDTAYGNGERKYIARWNGTQWQGLRNGTSDLVTVMKEFNGDLIVGGYFMSVDQIYAPKIARWDGTSWRSMGIGMSGPVLALCVYNGELYAGGNFIYGGEEVCNGIAKWDGSSWHPVGQGITGGEAAIYSLCVYNGELWAGGSFISVDNTPALNIAKFNGTHWSSTGEGAWGMNCYSSGGRVSDMKECKGSLFVIGQFTKICGVNANKIVSYNGRYWCPVEFGVDVIPAKLEVYKNELIVNGFFNSISGRSFSNIAAYKPRNTFLGSPGNQGQLADKFTLLQNYPNPFNPVTHFKFLISDFGFVTLKIFDALGKEITTRVNEELQPGVYNIEFDGSNLPSGVYFYRLTAGKFTETKKMLIVK